MEKTTYLRHADTGAVHVQGRAYPSRGHVPPGTHGLALRVWTVQETKCGLRSNRSQLYELPYTPQPDDVCKRCAKGKS